MDFVYYFCTSAGHDPNQPVPENTMATALARMQNTVAGNKALETRLQSFMPRWRVLGRAPAHGGAILFEPKRASVPLERMVWLGRELASILEWDGDHKAGAE